MSEVSSASARLWRPGAIERFAAAGNPAEAIRMVGALLVAEGAATLDHVEAAVRREADHPTGLPAEVPFALVHTDEPGALEFAAAMGIFDRPVEFQRMDDARQMLPLRLVIFLSVPRRELQAEILSELIGSLAKREIAEALLEAQPAEALRLMTT